MADLGSAPPSNSYLLPDSDPALEKKYPLRVLVCEKCWLAQTEDFVDREECFSANYAYFSSCSASWVEHAGRYASAMAERLSLGKDSLVAEIASNDGYLLRHFQAAGIPCYGVEPTESTAAVARAAGLDIVPEFFGTALAEKLLAERGPVDLLAANNVLAHVPDINDFAKGAALLVGPNGTATFEFPHLLQLLEQNYFDTIYHEHFSYLSLGAVTRIFRTAGLAVVDVEELPTHGGSLRVYARQADGGASVSPRVTEFLSREQKAGLEDSSVYSAFQPRISRLADAFVTFLREDCERGAKIAGYGAAAKGNTFLNFAGIDGDLIKFVVDRSPGKAGKLLPGSRIPVRREDHLLAEKPDVIVILPWNLRDEIARQLTYTRDWGARFAVALPELEIF
jgi:SAM-dependent methyltransferase